MKFYERKSRLVSASVVVASMALAAASCSSGSVEVATTSVAVTEGLGTTEQPDYRPVEVSGNALVQPPQDGSADPAAGAVAPDLTGVGLNGLPVEIKNDGRPKAVVFVAHWCPHCQAEIPVIADLLAQGEKPDGMDLYVVSTAVFSDRENFPPSAWLNEANLDVPIMVDSAEFDALISFGGGGFPFTVYLDAENRVLKRTQGTAEAATIKDLWLETAAA